MDRFCAAHRRNDRHEDGSYRATEVGVDWGIKSGDTFRVPSERQLSIVLHGQYGADCQRRVRTPLADWYRQTAAAVWEAIATLTTATGQVPALTVVHSSQSLPRLLTLGAESVLV
jgi:hypothetical protein